MKSKKAQQMTSQTIVCVLLSMVLFVVGIVLITNTFAGADIKIKFQTRELDYGVLAQRLVSSSDCFAWEEQYTDVDGTLKNQVHAGTIDLDKVRRLGAGVVLSNCLKGKKAAIELTDAQGTSLIQLTGDAGERPVTDYYLVKVRKADGSFTDGNLMVQIST